MKNLVWCRNSRYKHLNNTACECMLSSFSHVWLSATLSVVGSLPGSSVRGFSRQEHWSGLPCPPPGNLPDPEIEPVSLRLLHCRQLFTTESPGKPRRFSKGLGYTLRKYGGVRGTSKLKYSRWVDRICQKIGSRLWKPEHCPWHSRLMLPTGGTVHYEVHWQRNSPTISTLWGFPLSFERETQTLATTIEPDGVFSSHEFLPVSKPFQVISKQLKSKFR